MIGALLICASLSAVEAPAIVVTVPDCPRCVVSVPVVAVVKPAKPVAKAAVVAGKTAVAVTEKAVAATIRRPCAGSKCDIRVNAPGVRVRIRR